MVSVKSEVAQNDKCKENIGSKNTTYFFKKYFVSWIFSSSKPHEIVRCVNVKKLLMM